MKKYISIATFLLLTIISHGQTTVNFTYDLDGNMKQRLVFIVSQSNVKRSDNSNEQDTVEDNLEDLKIRIYPNPTDGIFQISLSAVDSEQKNYYCLYALNGALLQKRKIDKNNTSVNIASYSNGTYLLDLFLGDNISRWKIIKK